MNSLSSSKAEAEAGLKSQVEGEWPSRREDISNEQTLKTKLVDFVRSVTSDSGSLMIREIIGTISCSSHSLATFPATQSTNQQSQ